MRLVWRKRFGFSLVAYPVETKGTEIGGFKAGIFDSSGDLWWFSNETVEASATTESLAYKGWMDILEEFVSSDNTLPDGTDPVDAKATIEHELAYALLKIEVPSFDVVDASVPSIKSALKEAITDDAKGNEEAAGPVEKVHSEGDGSTGEPGKEAVKEGS